MPAKIFISYRRDDSGGYSRGLYEDLGKEFGDWRIFWDREKILGGEDFEKKILIKIRESNVLLALIGKRWLTVLEDDGTRRLDAPGDYVRREIETALSLGLFVLITSLYWLHWQIIVK